MKSRNFKIKEIAHRDLPADKRELAAFQQGYMQAIADNLAYHFKKTVPIKITSGYRSPEVNQGVSATDQAKKTSNHIWRLEKDYIRCANDFVPVGVDLFLAYYALEWVRGEFYYNKQEGILHMAQQGDEVKNHWIQ